MPPTALGLKPALLMTVLASSLRHLGIIAKYMYINFYNRTFQIFTTTCLIMRLPIQSAALNAIKHALTAKFGQFGLE